LCHATLSCWITLTKYFAGDVKRLMAKVKLTRLDDVPLSEIFFEMLSIARKNKVILEPNFTTLILGTVVIEGSPLLEHMVS